VYAYANYHTQQAMNPKPPMMAAMISTQGATRIGLSGIAVGGSQQMTPAKVSAVAPASPANKQVIASPNKTAKNQASIMNAILGNTSIITPVT